MIRPSTPPLPIIPIVPQCSEQAIKLFLDTYSCLHPQDMDWLAKSTKEELRFLYIVAEGCFFKQDTSKCCRVIRSWSGTDPFLQEGYFVYLRVSKSDLL